MPVVNTPVTKRPSNFRSRLSTAVQAEFGSSMVCSRTLNGGGEASRCGVMRMNIGYCGVFKQGANGCICLAGRCQCCGMQHRPPIERTERYRAAVERWWYAPDIGCGVPRPFADIDGIRGAERRRHVVRHIIHEQQCFSRLRVGQSHAARKAGVGIGGDANNAMPGKLLRRRADQRSEACRVDSADMMAHPSLLLVTEPIYVLDQMPASRCLRSKQRTHLASQHLPC